MFDIGTKPETSRIAIATALVTASPSTISIIKDGKSPKGDVKEVAKIAATMAAKKTSDLIPFCHPIEIDYIKVDVLIKEKQIEIIAEVHSISKTGVEMEALTAASIAALTVYDMLKPIDNNLLIESIKLQKKIGGIGDFEEINANLRAAILVCSDTRSEKIQDLSGKIINEKLAKNGFEIVKYEIVKDDKKIIIENLKNFCDELKVNLVITCGGTGLGPRDITPDATKEIIEKEVSGISEMLRSYGQKRTLLSMLSRGITGIRGNTVIINLPGSVKAVSESLDALFPGIQHSFKMISGHGH